MEHHASSHASHGHPGGSGTQQSLNRLSVSATLHCMTGCVLGETVGLVVATALGWGHVASIALAVGLAFLFGYALTSLPLFRAGLTLGAVVPIALATDTVSITIMEVIDNAFMVAIPGAMDSSLDDLLFWAPMLGGFAIAFPFAFLANRWLLARGKGHALVHQYHH
jgi:hypothetical protein